MPNQTGPTSFAGRLSSSMNNYRHGGQSTTLFLASEDPAEFFVLMEDAFAQHQPQFEQDAALVTDSVRARWILNRRQRAADDYDAHLYTHKPDGRQFLSADLKDAGLLDRYVTQAERSLQRCLQSLRIIKGITRDDQKWRDQFSVQKEKLEGDVERWTILKEKEKSKFTPAETPQASEEEIPDLPKPTNPGPANAIQQTVYISMNPDGTHVIREATPSTESILDHLRDDDHVTRTYNFIGGVPAFFKHLITKDAVSWGKSTSVCKTYSCDDWLAQVHRER